MIYLEAFIEGLTQAQSLTLLPLILASTFVFYKLASNSKGQLGRIALFTGVLISSHIMYILMKTSPTGNLFSTIAVAFAILSILLSLWMFDLHRVFKSEKIQRHINIYFKLKAPIILAFSALLLSIDDNEGRFIVIYATVKGSTGGISLTEYIIPFALGLSVPFMVVGTIAFALKQNLSWTKTAQVLAGITLFFLSSIQFIAYLAEF